MQVYDIHDAENKEKNSLDVRDIKGYKDGDERYIVYISIVDIYPKEITLKKGCQYYGAYAEIYPQCADNTDIIWSSDNEDVVLVDAENGRIYAKESGIATISATAKEGGASSFAKVTVCHEIPAGVHTLREKKEKNI